MFYLSSGGPYGDPIAEITPYKEGYLLKSYGPEEQCLAFDYISKEDGDEIIKFKDNPNRAFGGCGVEEVFNHKYTRLKEFIGFGSIIDAIVYNNDEEINKFMERIYKNMNTYHSDIYDYMYEELEKDYDNVDDFMKEIEAKPTFKEQCDLYDYYKHS